MNVVVEEKSADTVFQRFARPDLANAELAYKDDASCYATVPWGGGKNEWRNCFRPHPKESGNSSVPESCPEECS